MEGHRRTRSAVARAETPRLHHCTGTLSNSSKTIRRHPLGTYPPHSADQIGSRLQRTRLDRSSTYVFTEYHDCDGSSSALLPFSSHRNCGGDEVEYVCESTGAFTTTDGCMKHVEGGAKKVPRGERHGSDAAKAVASHSSYGVYKLDRNNKLE